MVIFRVLPTIQLITNIIIHFHFPPRPTGPREVGSGNGWKISFNKCGPKKQYGEKIIEPDVLLGLENHSAIEFGGKHIYLPIVPIIIYFSNDGNRIDIDFQGDDDAYALVNGIRCYEVVTYDKSTNKVSAFIKEYTIDGMKGAGPIPVDFDFDATETTYAKKIIKLQQHPEEVID